MKHTGKEEKVARLKAKRVIVTTQRYAVLDFLQDNAFHPTAEDIYQSLKGMYPAFSRATVYNTLDLLKRYDLIKEITIERERAHYDYRTGPHYHFFCRQCRRIYDVEMKGLKKYPLNADKLIEGHTVDDVCLYLVGTCYACLKGGYDAGAS